MFIDGASGQSVSPRQAVAAAHFARGPCRAHDCALVRPENLHDPAGRTCRPSRRISGCPGTVEDMRGGSAPTSWFTSPCPVRRSVSKTSRRDRRDRRGTGQDRASCQSSARFGPRGRIALGGGPHRGRYRAHALLRHGHPGHDLDRSLGPGVLTRGAWGLRPESSGDGPPAAAGGGVVAGSPTSTIGRQLFDEHGLAYQLDRAAAAPARPRRKPMPAFQAAGRIGYVASADQFETSQEFSAPRSPADLDITYLHLMKVLRAWVGPNGWWMRHRRYTDRPSTRNPSRPRSTRR